MCLCVAKPTSFPILTLPSSLVVIARGHRAVTVVTVHMYGPISSPFALQLICCCHYERTAAGVACKAGMVSRQPVQQLPCKLVVAAAAGAGERRLQDHQCSCQMRGLTLPRPKVRAGRVQFDAGCNIAVCSGDVCPYLSWAGCNGVCCSGAPLVWKCGIRWQWMLCARRHVVGVGCVLMWPSIGALMWPSSGRFRRFVHS